MTNRRSGPSSPQAVVQALHTVVRGRARFHVQGLRGSSSLKQYVESCLPQVAGITSVSASVVTGHVLVLFDPAIAAPERPPQKAWQGIAAHLVRLIHSHQRAPSPATGSAERNSTELAQVPCQSPTSPPWHTQDLTTVLETFHTSAETGLSPQAVRLNRQTYGPNLLPETPPRSRLGLFFDQFKTPPVALLSAAAGISLFTGGLADALVIMGVVLINAAIGYTTETQSDRIIRSLKQLVSPVAWVIRQGEMQELNAQDIVPGDLLVLRPGTYVAADAKVVEANHLSVDESALTGESLPVLKTVAALTDPQRPLGDRTNMVHMGTLVTGGQGLAVVVATAQATEMGQIQAMVGQAVPPPTPMERQLDRAGGQLVWLSSSVCGLVFALGLWRGYALLDMLKTSIALAVAAVPEGLPAVATTTLALGIRDMRKHKVLIRRLDAVETLGSLQALCLDKTGTLTTNQMTVVEVQTDHSRLVMTEGPWPQQPHPQSGSQAADPSDPLQQLLRVIVLCNESEYQPGSPQPLKGSATENALLDLALKAGVDVAQVRADFPLVTIQHRCEDRNVMTTLHHPPGQKYFMAVKGNPCEVLALCNWQGSDRRVRPLSPFQRQAIEAENERMAARGLRILGVAYGHSQDPALEPDHNLVWLGLVGLADPIRPGVKEVMGVFHQAGIETVMITGDQSPTAYAIGQALDLSQGEQLQILDSTDLTQLAPEVVGALCDRVHIFSRISPANKLQVVQALQRAGKVVAMTGDGINDAPALKAAEVGIAMGHTGTDVAREVADVVLEDDDLATMAVAVSQGRTIYNNIRKSVHFLLSTNLSEIMVMLAGISLGLGQPLNAMQLLWLNLVTDIFPGLALALEPPEPDVLR
ncbi:MAG TPA: cation-transporting P-type ATPase, partial [Leptolyngbyaceae cyanobacterium M65_K2018_010]|nr:cation-transporting P-type ATPase [Leptolyngbyaceae cyanobacterium M65_K2018_010]